MKHLALENVNIVSSRHLPSPREVKERLPLSAKAAETVFFGRTAIGNILNRKDVRKLLVIGPCSIHDLIAAREYAERLRKLSEKVSDVLLVVMRVYFEKPRTVDGWKGFINDPYLDDSFRIDQGVLMGREFLHGVAELGLPTGTEALDPVMPQYLGDLVSWTAIGARTTESQTHRELASGLSTPIGFKNGTDGNIDVAINAMLSAARSHHFLGITQDGKCAVFETRGNAFSHVVLRGGVTPNYDEGSVRACEEKLRRAGLSPSIMIDCSHGNSLKDPARQPAVLDEAIRQIRSGNQTIIGFMLESNLEGGNQRIPVDRSELRYGVSVTDACIDWETTERIVTDSAARLR